MHGFQIPYSYVFYVYFCGCSVVGLFVEFLVQYSSMSLQFKRYHIQHHLRIIIHRMLDLFSGSIYLITLTLMLQVANFQMCETVIYGYSSESTKGELSNE